MVATTRYTAIVLTLILIFTGSTLPAGAFGRPARPAGRPVPFASARGGPERFRGDGSAPAPPPRPAAIARAAIPTASRRS